MKAIIKNKENEYFGVTATVIEILKNRIAVLAIDGKKIDFGMSEIKLLPSFQLGRYVAWEFQKMDTSGMFRDVDIKKTAKRASIVLKQKQSVLLKSLYLFV
jgi:hypothetical protein